MCGPTGTWVCSENHSFEFLLGSARTQNPPPPSRYWFPPLHIQPQNPSSRLRSSRSLLEHWAQAKRREAQTQASQSLVQYKGKARRRKAQTQVKSWTLRNPKIKYQIKNLILFFLAAISTIFKVFNFPFTFPFTARNVCSIFESWDRTFDRARARENDFKDDVKQELESEFEPDFKDDFTPSFKTESKPPRTPRCPKPFGFSC